MEPGPFAEMIGEYLSGITFVMDYLQLQFNPPLSLSIYTPTTVRCGEATAVFGEPAFANLLLAQIGKTVAAVNLAADEFLQIRFEDGSTLAVSLRPEDYVGPEAVNIICRDHGVAVI
ncbi:MAG TPA: hypothetical protein VNT75_23605 [Symbiobacteriaceae bacterium]|nr:hypothetical protein [Symbiobacteriaceae bacterium]